MLNFAARGEVRWDGTFNRPPTPSTVRDMADRVVGRQRNPIPLFCAGAEMAKKRRGGLTCVQGVMRLRETSSFVLVCNKVYSYYLATLEG